MNLCKAAIAFRILVLITVAASEPKKWLCKNKQSQTIIIIKGERAVSIAARTLFYFAVRFLGLSSDSNHHPTLSPPHPLQMEFRKEALWSSLWQMFHLEDISVQ